MPAEAWSASEIESTVAAYFAMLDRELAGVDCVKADYNRRVQAETGRTRAAVEYKFQNVSAVLVNHGQVYLRGYLPAQNYQRALEASVLEWLEGHNDPVEAAEVSPLLNPSAPGTVPRFGEILSTPPEPGRAAAGVVTGRGIRVDFVRRDAENRALGLRGEEFVVQLERRRLHDDEQRPDLAKRVRWSSRDEGGGLGYDITSFEAARTPRLIEVKTTGLGKYFPFAVTQNELVCSKRLSDSFHLYRLYDFGLSPRLYILPGALDEACTLSPALYRASVAPQNERI
jgi:hypothetical protein